MEVEGEGGKRTQREEAGETAAVCQGSGDT